MLLDHPFKADARVEKEAKTLHAAGYSITVAAEMEQGLAVTEERSHYKVIRSFDPRFKAPLRIGYSRFIVECADSLLDQSFDLIHCHDYAMLPIAFALKERRQVPVIYDSHEYLKGWPLYETASSPLKKLKSFLVWKRAQQLEARYGNRADAVVTITNQIAEKLQIQLKRTSLPLVIRNIPQSFDAVNNKYFHKLLNLPPETRVIIQSGSLNQTHEQMLDLLQLVGSTQNLVLIISGSLQTHRNLEARLIDHEGYNNYFFFHEYLKIQQEQCELLANADIGSVSRKKSVGGA